MYWNEYNSIKNDLELEKLPDYIAEKICLIKKHKEGANMLGRTSKKVVLTFAIMLCIIWMGGTKALAQTVAETEPNDSKETAQLIQASKETAVQAATASRIDQYVIDGYASIGDTDWYQVYLNSGTQYVTCNGFDYNFAVYDDNDNIILSKSYSKSSYGPRAYSFEADASGYYYIRVQGITSSSKSYILSVGDHTYGVAHCQVNLGSVNMSNKTDFTRVIDLTDNYFLPEGAIVYDMYLDGLRTSNASYAIINNITQNSKFNLGPSIYSISNIAARGLKVDSRWEITIGYKKDTIINPKFMMFFVYPVTSEFLPDDEIVVNAF